MFEGVRLLGDREKSIVLQTRCGRNVPNVVEQDPPYSRRRRTSPAVFLRAHNSWEIRQAGDGILQLRRPRLGQPPDWVCSMTSTRKYCQSSQMTATES